MSNIAETLTASGWKEYQIKGDFLRLMNAAGTVEIVYYSNGAEMARTGVIQAGYAETFRNGGFTALRIYDKSGAANAIEFVHRINADVRYDRAPTGAILVTNTGPNGKIPVQETGADYGVAFKNAAAMAANTPDTVFTPAANVNGAIIWECGFGSNNGSANGVTTLLAKNAAPASYGDGVVILAPQVMTPNGANFRAYARSDKPRRIPAGLGLYFIASEAETSNNLRHCTYTLL